ncbi:unnamed protein product [Gulo gulo]|uniref:Uncharacterized protein n=1 Tax=Gulo gulo TaxID=48420 RepID=A0A9X9PZ66_GULGU|nr:unnamed protein product [Gulo gulo]
MKNPPKPECDAGEGSRDSQDACLIFGHMKVLGVMKQKIPQRKL